MTTMFHEYYLNDDPFNKNNNRNLKNTQRHTFNCGGYALGTFSWYCPHDEEDEDCFWGYNYGFRNREEAWTKTMFAVSKMVLDFGGKLRMIKTMEQLHRDERVVAFRLSSDGDFHYVRREANGRWYHKQGRSPDIRPMTKAEVFSDCWCYRYNGPLVLLAIKN